MSRSEGRCPGPVAQRGRFTRRSFLELGSLALGGLCLRDLLRLREAQGVGASSPPDTAVILIWLQGGPTHIDMYDLKPEAPDSIRGPFQPISTVVPGLDVCEHMPLHAKVADKLSIIRSISHKWAGHQGGTQRFITGYDPPRPQLSQGAFPEIGSVVAKVREGINVGVPNYVCSSRGVPYGGPAYLGNAASPFVVSGDPNSPKFTVRNITPPPELAGALDDRATLLKGLDTFRRELDRSGSMDALDKFDRQALDLLTSDKVRRAFDIAQEPDALRDKYGRHKWGQRALLARRLVEAGCSFVTMVLQNAQVGKASNWDDHAVNWHIFDENKKRLPIYDRAVCSLIEDLYDRGLDKKVMLIVAGEFGRTPRINYNRGVGRGHYPHAMSVLVSGGGMRMGQVIGSTDDEAAHPKDRPLAPEDLWATVYRFLGIDINRKFVDRGGREVRILPGGEPIAELI